MKLVVVCEPDQAEAAFALLLRESREFAEYTKIGWGWSFGIHGHPDFSAFVRRLKDGLSVHVRARP